MIFNKADVAVRNNAAEFAIFESFNDWNTTDSVFAHQTVCFKHGVFRRKVERIDDNAAFGTFYFAHFISLLFNRHVLMDNAKTALTRHCDCHGRFRDRIHAGTDDWDIELQIICKLNAEVNIIW